MATRVCVGNRQGGVGKSTVTMMLAHALAILGRKRVLVIDLDTQCNSSFAMIGSARWRKAAEGQATLSEYMGRLMRGRPVNPMSFIIENVSDVSEGGAATRIDLMPSAIELDEEIQDAIVETRLKDPFNAMNLYVRELLSQLDERYDFILMDCPPGLSPLVNAAVGLGNRVIVPFRPDYISQFALDRMADKVEQTGKRSRTRKRLDSIPHDRRRYVSVVNMLGGTAAERTILDDFDGVHPRLKTQLKRQPDIAEAFYWQEEPRSLSEKYGKAEPQVKDLYNDVREWLDASRPSSASGAAAA
ncbi:MAG: ParA family protein [Hyphomicrobiaceae bacterium]